MVALRFGYPRYRLHGYCREPAIPDLACARAYRSSAGTVLNDDI